MTTDLPESPFVCFTEFRKKVGEDDWAVLHITLRDDDDTKGVARVNALIKSMVTDGWQHADSPKPKSAWGNRGSGGKPAKAEIPADGRFEVQAFAKAHFADKDNIRVYGVGGEETVAWDGRALQTFVTKHATISAVQDAFANWHQWTLNDKHTIPFKTNRLIAVCEKSVKGSWFVKEFVIEPKEVQDAKAP